MQFFLQQVAARVAEGYLGPIHSPHLLLMLSVRHLPSPNFRLAEPAALTIFSFFFHVDFHLDTRVKGQHHHWHRPDVWPLCRQYFSRQ